MLLSRPGTADTAKVIGRENPDLFRPITPESEVSHLALLVAHYGMNMVSAVEPWWHGCESWTRADKHGNTERYKYELYFAVEYIDHSDMHASVIRNGGEPNSFSKILAAGPI